MLILDRGMKKPPPNTYPNNILEIRKKMGIGQKPIYTALGLTQAAFSDIENGRTNFNVGKAVIIANVLGCRISELSKEFENISKTNGPIVHHEASGKTQSSRSLPIADGIELAIQVATKSGRKPSDGVIDFARQSLLKMAAGSTKPLTAQELVDYATGFLSMKRNR